MFEDCAETEIADLNTPELINEKITALEITVNDWRFACVQIKHSTSSVCEHIQQKRPFDDVTVVVEDLLEGTTCHVFHDDTYVVWWLEGTSEEL